MKLARKPCTRRLVGEVWAALFGTIERASIERAVTAFVSELASKLEIVFVSVRSLLHCIRVFAEA